MSVDSCKDLIVYRVNDYARMYTLMAESFRTPQVFQFMSKFFVNAMDDLK